MGKQVNNPSPFFTVVIPTRNRVELFKLALDSVLAQTFSNFEVVVVNDGSDSDALEQYKALEQQYREQPVKFVYQIKRPNGHGQSYSMNTGAYVGNGQYVCFLDDDDFWIDKTHLEKAYESISLSASQVDAYYTNQTAYFSDGRRQTDNVWIEDLAPRIKGFPQDKNGAASVTAEFLLTSGGFAHLNCSIVRRELYLNIKGMDENIRYECDRDIFIRTIDAASHILYQPNFVSQHHIPDPKKSDNMSTMINAFEKYIYQINVYEKAILLSQKKAVREHSSKAIAYIYKRITLLLKEQKDYKRTAQYAGKALSHGFGIKWYLFTLLMRLRSMVD